MIVHTKNVTGKRSFRGDPENHLTITTLHSEEVLTTTARGPPPIPSVNATQVPPTTESSNESTVEPKPGKSTCTGTTTAITTESDGINKEKKRLKETSDRIKNATEVYMIMFMCIILNSAKI